MSYIPSLKSELRFLTALRHNADRTATFDSAAPDLATKFKNANWRGALVLQLKKKGWIFAVGYEKSKRHPRNANPNRVWHAAVLDPFLDARILELSERIAKLERGDA